MRFLLDESADFPLARFLRELGHDITAIAHDYPHALKDSEVLSIAVAERRILITNDRDFGELIFRRQLSHAGVILFRLSTEDIQIKKDRLTYVLTNHSQDLGDFIVISDQRIRVRRVRRG
jgi:predicted nuclease of predicted toxin-antitoxin system